MLWVVEGFRAHYWGLTAQLIFISVAHTLSLLVRWKWSRRDTRMNENRRRALRADTRHDLEIVAAGIPDLQPASTVSTLPSSSALSLAENNNRSTSSTLEKTTSVNSEINAVRRFDENQQHYILELSDVSPQIAQNLGLTTANNSNTEENMNINYMNQNVMYQETAKPGHNHHGGSSDGNYRSSQQTTIGGTSFTTMGGGSGIGTNSNMPYLRSHTGYKPSDGGGSSSSATGERRFENDSTICSDTPLIRNFLSSNKDATPGTRGGSILDSKSNENSNTNIYSKNNDTATNIGRFNLEHNLEENNTLIAEEKKIYQQVLSNTNSNTPLQAQPQVYGNTTGTRTGLNDLKFSNSASESEDTSTIKDDTVYGNPNNTNGTTNASTNTTTELVSSKDRKQPHYDPKFNLPEQVPEKTMMGTSWPWDVTTDEEALTTGSSKEKSKKNLLKSASLGEVNGGGSCSSSDGNSGPNISDSNISSSDNKNKNNSTNSYKFNVFNNNQTLNKSLKHISRLKFNLPNSSNRNGGGPGSNSSGSNSNSNSRSKKFFTINRNLPLVKAKTCSSKNSDHWLARVSEHSKEDSDRESIGGNDMGWKDQMILRREVREVDNPPSKDTGVNNQSQNDNHQRNSRNYLNKETDGKEIIPEGRNSSSSSQQGVNKDVTTPATSSSPDINVVIFQIGDRVFINNNAPSQLRNQHEKETQDDVLPGCCFGP